MNEQMDQCIWTIGPNTVELLFRRDRGLLHAVHSSYRADSGGGVEVEIFKKK